MQITLTVPYSHLGEVFSADLSAEKIGAFAIHPSLDIGKGISSQALAWTVTHIKTCRAITFAHDEAGARNAAERFNRMPVSWDFTEQDAPTKWPAPLQRLAQDIAADARA